MISQCPSCERIITALFKTCTCWHFLRGGNGLSKVCQRLWAVFVLFLHLSCDNKWVSNIQCEGFCCTPYFSIIPSCNGRHHNPSFPQKTFGLPLVFTWLLQRSDEIQKWFSGWSIHYFPSQASLSPKLMDFPGIGLISYTAWHSEVHDSSTHQSWPRGQPLCSGRYFAVGSP